MKKKSLSLALLIGAFAVNGHLAASSTEVSTYDALVNAINDASVTEISITSPITSNNTSYIGGTIARSIEIDGNNNTLSGQFINTATYPGLYFAGNNETFKISNITLSGFSDRNSSDTGTAVRVGSGYAELNNVTFDRNFNKTYAPALYVHMNTGSTTASAKVIDCTFTNNESTGNIGAVWNRSNLTIVANEKNVEFSGNKANGTPRDITNAGTLNLNAAEGQSITFNDGGIDNTGTININSSDKAEQTKGSVYLNGYINGGTVNLYDGTLKLDENGTLEGATLVARGGSVDFQDNKITTTSNLGTVDTSNSVLNVTIDAQLIGGTGSNDAWTSTAVTGSNGMYISEINLLSDDGQGGTLTLSAGLSDDYTLIGQSANYLIAKPNETTLSFVAGGLPAAVQNTTSTRTYSMIADETISSAAGSVGGTSGQTTNFIINANNHTINGNNLEGITMQTSSNAGYLSNMNINDATITGFNSNGGGVVFQRQGDLTVTNSNFDGNTSLQLGGAVRVQNGAATFIDTNFTNNTVTKYTDAGGAIAIQNGTVNIISDTNGVLFEGNTSKGTSNAINISGGTLNLKAGNSDIVFKDAITSSGGTINIQSAYGDTNGTGKVVNNSTIQANALNISGGELYTNISDITVASNTIGLSGNGILTLTDSEIAMADMPVLTGSGGFLGLSGKATIDTASFVGTNKGLILDGADITLNKNGTNYTNMAFSSVNVSDNGANINMADTSTATYNFGDLVLNGDLTVALDAKFGSNSIDKITASTVTGDGNIIITNIKNQSDGDASHYQTQIGFGAAMNIIRLADDFTLDLSGSATKPKEEYYTISYNNTNGILTYILSENMTLKMAVDDAQISRIYNMGKDEEVNNNLGWMAGGEGASLTVNANGHNINGNVEPTGGVAEEHVIVRDGQTLAINNVGSGDATTDGWNNFQSQKGGAVLFYGDGEINNSTFKNNSSVNKDDPTELYETGGAVTVAGGNLTIKDSYFGNNSAKRGGAVAVIYEDEVAGSLYIENTTFTGNHASDIGGALYNNDTANTAIVDSVFTNNSADSSGGAIFNRNDSTVNLIAKNTGIVIAGNTSGDSSNGIDNNGILNLNSSDDTNVVILDAISMSLGSPVGEINVNKDLTYVDAAGDTQSAPTTGTVELHHDVTANGINIEAGTLDIVSDKNAVNIDSTIIGKDNSILNLNAGNDSVTVKKEVDADTINVNSANEISIVEIDEATGEVTVTKDDAPTVGEVTLSDNVTANLLNVEGTGKLITTKDKTVTLGEFNVAGGANVEQNANATVSKGINEGTISGTGSITFDGDYINALGSITQDLITVNDDATLDNYAEINSKIVNNGKINNEMFISGDITNSGKVNNKGIVESGDFTSSGEIDNSGYIEADNFTNSGKIDNSGAIKSNNLANTGTIDNTGNISGVVNNKKSGIINTPIEGLSGDIKNNGEIHYTSSGETIVDIKGNGTVHLDSDGTTTLNNNLFGNTLSLNSGTLIFGENKDISEGGMILNGGDIGGILDGKLTTYKLGNVKVAKNSNIKGIDFKLDDLTSDKFVGKYSGSGLINIDKVQVQGSTVRDYIKIHLSNTTKIAKNNLNVKDQKLPSVMTPIRLLSGRVEDNYLIYEGLGNSYNDFNPAVMASSVAAHVGGMNAQTEAFRHGFYHMNRYTKYSSADRLSAENYNKVAISDNVTVNPQVENPLIDEAMWVKPYTSWESVHLKHGPKVNSFSYGNFYGGDTDLVDIGNGFKGVLSAFIGYNGNHMSYDDISMDMEGGTLGLTGTAYKGNFFTGITASTGASAVQAYTPYGTDHFGMINAGIANKTGYNWEIKDGRVIVQPTLLLGYTFVNTFDYTNSAGAKIESDPLNAVQIMPELKIIGNTKTGWQPYATVGMVYNIFVGNHTVTAGNVKLPQLSNRAYVQYGVGIQRSWADRFTAFAEALLRNGGRNGVMLFGGFRWNLGKDNSKKNVKNTVKISETQPVNKKIIKAITK